MDAVRRALTKFCDFLGLELLQPRLEDDGVMSPLIIRPASHFEERVSDFWRGGPSGRGGNDANLQQVSEELNAISAERDSFRRRLETIKAKHAAEIERMEDEVDTLVKSHEQARVRTQEAANDTVERRIADQGELYKEKTKRALESSETMWKARLKQAQDDYAHLEARLGKARTALDLAHQSEKHANKTLEINKGDLEGQRDVTLKKLWKAEAEITALTERLEKEQKSLKKAKTRGRKSDEQGLADQLALKTKLDETQGVLVSSKADLAETQGKLQACNETIGKMQGAADRKQAQVVKLQAEAKELEGTLVDVQEVLATTTDELQQETDKTQGLTAEVAALRAAAEELAAKTAEELAAVRAALAEATSERNRLQSELDHTAELLKQASTELKQGETDRVEARRINEAWDAKEADLSRTAGELKGTQLELQDAKTLLDSTQGHTVELQGKLKAAEAEVHKFKHQSASVEKLKATLAVAYKDMESGRDKFLSALTEFNTKTTAATSLHSFDF